MGSSSATVIAGPIPGSTPTAVPSSTPMTAYNRFIGVAASPNPWISQSRFSMSENPIQNACGQRDSEPGVERIEAADREHRPDHDVADVVPATQNGGCAREQQCAGDGPSQRLNQQDGSDEHSDEQAYGAPVGRSVGVDILAGVGLADRSARDRDRKDDGQHDKDDSDGQREESRTDRIHLGEAGVEGDRVVDEERSDRDEHRTNDVLRLVNGFGDLVRLRLFGGGHSSPSSVRVDETRLSWSFRNCSNCAPVTNASVQPFFTNASFHCGVPCISSSTLTIACLASSEIPGGASTPRQLANVRSIPDSLSVGASTPSIRSSLDTASTRSCAASIWSMSSPGLDVPTVIFLPSRAVSRSPPPS